MIDLEELRQNLTDGEITLNDPLKIIQSGELSQSILYEIKHGWHIGDANDCDTTWTEFYTQLFNHLQSQDLSPEKEVLSSLSTQDKRWNWFNKAYMHKSNEFRSGCP